MKQREPVELSCSTNDPGIKVIWQKDGQPLDHLVTLFTDGTAHKAMITAAAIGNSGQYTCQITNTDVVTTCLLTVTG